MILPVLRNLDIVFCWVFMTLGKVEVLFFASCESILQTDI